MYNLIRRLRRLCYQMNGGPKSTPIRADVTPGYFGIEASRNMQCLEFRSELTDDNLHDWMSA